MIVLLYLLIGAFLGIHEAVEFKKHHGEYTPLGNMILQGVFVGIFWLPVWIVRVCLKGMSS